MANSKNCNIVADAIEASESYDQGCYSHDCNTPACVAGHTVMALDKEFICFGNLADGSFYHRRNPDKPEIISVSLGAELLLELDSQQSLDLFAAYPLQGKIVTQRVAAKVLRLLATDGIVRWERFQ